MISFFLCFFFFIPSGGWCGAEVLGSLMMVVKELVEELVWLTYQNQIIVFYL
jgi:hypothetical protein